MRRILYFILLSGLYLPSTSVAQLKQEVGIHFFKGDWKSLLNAAGQQDKLIFVDVYTDWCPPCKRMEQEIFPLAEVGKIYNELFINYRLNAEQDANVKLANDYAVKAYPTYLFLDSGGYLLYRTSDYLKAVDFIAAGRIAAAKKNESGSLNELETRFNQGDRHPAFLKAFLEKRTSLGMDNAEILNAYMAVVSQEELRKPESLLFLSSHMGSTVSNVLPILMDNIKVFDNSSQRQIADNLYNGLLYYALGTAMKENKLNDAGILMADIKNIRPLLSEKYLPSADNLALHYYQKVKDESGLKAIGYQIATKQMAIPIDSIHKKDRLLFEQAMQPFLSGKQDSTKITGFQEEKKLAAIQYSANVAGTLYTVANAFKLTLQGKDKALNDARQWVQAAYRLYPHEAIRKLMVELEEGTQ
jgi:thiol-disulfide isomerase/thioredoxin